MSWHCTAVGRNKIALKAGVAGWEYVPQSIKDRIGILIDRAEPKLGQVIYIQTNGHFNTPSAWPSGADTETTVVSLVPFWE